MYASNVPRWSVTSVVCVGHFCGCNSLSMLRRQACDKETRSRYYTCGRIQVLHVSWATKLRIGFCFVLCGSVPRAYWLSAWTARVISSARWQMLQNSNVAKKGRWRTSLLVTPPSSARLAGSASREAGLTNRAEDGGVTSKLRLLRNGNGRLALFKVKVQGQLGRGAAVVPLDRLQFKAQSRSTCPWVNNFTADNPALHGLTTAD